MQRMWENWDRKKAACIWECRMLKLAFFFSALFCAAVIDSRKRVVPDGMVFLVALLSFLPPDHPHLTGLLAALPLFLAGITIGGIGGGDVKLMGVCGLVLGGKQASAGLFLGLCLLLIWHAVKSRKRNQRKEEREQAYPFVPFLFLGMFCIFLLGG